MNLTLRKPDVQKKDLEITKVQRKAGLKNPLRPSQIEYIQKSYIKENGYAVSENSIQKTAEWVLQKGGGLSDIVNWVLNPM